MEDYETQQIERKIDALCFGMYQSRGLYKGMDFEGYEKLLSIEREISKSPTPRDITLEDVSADMVRNSTLDLEPLICAYRSNVCENKPQYFNMFGHQDMVVYMARGIYKNDINLGLVLVSAHIPGKPSSGGWGSIGIRRLQLTKAKFIGYNLKKENNLEKLFENTYLASAYEYYDKKIHYSGVNSRSENLLRDIVAGATLDSQTL